MGISRNARSLTDFPEFAQAVRYGVPGIAGIAGIAELRNCGIAELGKQLGMVSPELGKKPVSAADFLHGHRVLPGDAMKS